MDQNTDEWLKWRSKGLGASDIPIVLGVSKFKTPYQLWEEKTGLVVKDREKDNWAQAKGHALEDAARENYEFETDMEAKPITMVHPIHEWLRASLDGWNAENKIVLEIKCPGEKDHTLAWQRRVPLAYWWQMQTQLLVSGGQLGHYYSFANDKYGAPEGILLEVLPDPEAAAAIIERGGKFWGQVKAKEPPELVDADFKTEDGDDWKGLVADYRNANARLKDAKKEVDIIKKQLTDKMDHTRVACDGLKITKVTRKGNVDYSKVSALKGVDLEEYRKPASVSYRITDDNDKKKGKK
jgi:putative phage-type endonuclease